MKPFQSGPQLLLSFHTLWGWLMAEVTIFFPSSYSRPELEKFPLAYPSEQCCPVFSMLYVAEN